MPNSTTPSNPAKPSKDFPLSIHKGSGRWCKKIKGRVHYFGYLSDDPEGVKAAELWNEKKDDLLAGRTPRPKADGLILGKLLSEFMASKKESLDTGEIGLRYFDELYATCRRIGDCFNRSRLVIDFGPEDFKKLRKAISETWGPVRLMNEIQRVRSVFNFAAPPHNTFIDKPVLFGKEFKKPSKKVLRVNRAKNAAENGKRMFPAAELRAIIEAAGVPLKAMILLGVNCGFGCADVANLPIKAMDLKTGWVEQYREKTGIERRAPLWPETVAAIQQAIHDRPRHKITEDAGIAFITAQGNRWAKTELSDPDPKTGDRKLATNTPVTKEFNKVLRRLGLKRKGVSFYALRHTFRTVGDETLDQVAVRYIMGHADESIDAAYREGIKDDRLRAVSDHVHAWLFG